MAVNWVTSFKTIPWTKVLSLAPTIGEGARKLWSSVKHRYEQIPKSPTPLQERISSHDPAMSAVETQLHALELRATQLGEELALSSELIDKLAEQQSQLVQAVDILRVRTRALLWACGLLGLAVVALLYLLIGR